MKLDKVPKTNLVAQVPPSLPLPGSPRPSDKLPDLDMYVE